MKKEKSTVSAIGGFLKRNAVYMVLTLCLIAVGVSVSLVLIQNSKKTTEVSNSINTGSEVNQTTTPENNGGTSSVVEKEDIPIVVTFTMPVEKYTTVEMYDETMAFNSTLKRYESHKAIDFFAEEGTKVFCAYDGVVESIDSQLLTGVTVTVNHGNGLKTVYNSLAEGDVVTVGQKLKKGDLVGVMSTSNRQEYKDGAHLHFETIENGKYINPEKYLSFSDK